MYIRKSDDRGHARRGWLDSRFSFSFAEYHDPEHMGYSALRAINQDRIQAGTGFGTHGHRDMEIVTYVLSGELEHRDSMGHVSRVGRGDVQLMSAGTGVTHSEVNPSTTEQLHLLQMWVLPESKGTAPRYEELSGDAGSSGRLQLVVSPDGAHGSLTIGQDARLFRGCFGAGERDTHQLEAGRCAWLHLARGALRLNGTELTSGDGAALDAGRLEIEAVQDAELILWDLPAAP